MTPAKFAKPEDFKLNVELFNTWQGITHWPHCNIRKQSLPERDEKPDPKNRTELLEEPVITDRILQSAAVKIY